MDWAHFFKLFAGLFAILNPIGAVPVFASLTQGRTPTERRRTAKITAVTVATVLLIAMLCGELLLRFFSITIPSFRIGGGILILLMAISMLHARRSGAKQSPEESLEAMARADIAVVPLGIPILAGPGSISTVILYRSHADSILEFLGIAGLIVVMASLVYLALRYATPIIERFGRTGLNIITRVMGLVLASMAVEFILDGLVTYFPGLTH